MKKAYFAERNFRNILDSAGVTGRNPWAFMIDSDSLTCRTPRSGFTSTKRGSMREVVREVIGRIFRAVADGKLEGILEINIVHPPLEPQALFSPEDIAVGNSMGGVITGDIDPLTVHKRQQNNGKLRNGALACCAIHKQGKSLKCFDPFLVRHAIPVVGLTNCDEQFFAKSLHKNGEIY